MKKRIFSLVLALVFAFSAMCSITVIAEDEGDPYGYDIDWGNTEALNISSVQFDVDENAALFTFGSNVNELVIDETKISIVGMTSDGEDGTPVVAAEGTATVSNGVVKVPFAQKVAPTVCKIVLEEGAFSGLTMQLGLYGFNEAPASSAAQTITSEFVDAQGMKFGYINKDIKITNVVMDFDTLTATLTFNQYVNMNKPTTVFLCTVPNPVGKNSETGETDQLSVNTVTYGDGYYEAASKKYSDSITFEFNNLDDDAKWVYYKLFKKTGTEVTSDEHVIAPRNVAGIRFQEANIGSAAYGDGYVDSQNIVGFIGSALKANWSTTTGNDMFWIPTDVWADFMQENATDAHKASYLGDNLANYTVVISTLTAICGDTDGSGDVGINDITTLAKALDPNAQELYGFTLNDLVFFACDTDGSGDVGINDITTLAKALDPNALELYGFTLSDLPFSGN